MRFLKNKILRAQEAKKKKSEKHSLLDDMCSKSEVDSQISTISTHASESIDSPLKSENKTSASQNGDSSMKNMTINYGRAIVTFTASPLALPYLQAYLEKEQINMAEFIAFAKTKKKSIAGISSFRSLLLIEDSDTEKMKAYKRVLQYMSEVFIKYFSVNWIMHGRLTHKITYLKFRFKMLRRIQNPHLFTYIKERKAPKRAK